MNLTFYSYTLKLKHKFVLSKHSRTTTPIVLTEIEHKGIKGYGEASLPPYLGETQEGVINFLSKVDLNKYDDPLKIEEILNEIDLIEPGNNAAKASVDIALHDLAGKILEMPLWKYFEIDSNKTPESSFTIGIDSVEMIEQKLDEAKNFKILKIKLGAGNDKEILEAVRSKTNTPIIVDVNQGWSNKHLALDMIEWLAEKNVKLVEQPLPVDHLDDIAWLNEQSPLPIFADEAVQRLRDLKNVEGVYSGINIKLMKSTGLNEAYKMILLAKEMGLQTMLGCMTETSCAISAAAQISPLVNWVDLDGAMLITNDIFDGMKIINGKITLPERNGIGIVKKLV